MNLVGAARGDGVASFEIHAGPAVLPGATEAEARGAFGRHARTPASAPLAGRAHRSLLLLGLALLASACGHTDAWKVLVAQNARDYYVRRYNAACEPGGAGAVECGQALGALEQWKKAEDEAIKALGRACADPRVACKTRGVMPHQLRALKNAEAATRAAGVK